ncbi:MAG: hypothetical protein FJZ01_06225, partial [Candidatus Sericytochromatia bacterium]|nr:hypothetical protein [Candidatus Tanganyikabacteria bacterium]
MRGADSIKRRLAPSLWPGIACGLALGIAGCLVPAGGMGGAGKVPGMAATLAPDSGTGSGARAQGGAGAGTGAAAAALDAVTTARAEV